MTKQNPTIFPLSVFLGGLLAAASAQANDTDWKKGKWEHLAPYIGTYNYEAVLNDPQVSAKLDSILGAQKQKLIDNMEGRSPIGFEDDCLVMNGSAGGTGYAESAYMNACIYKGTINIVLATDKTVTVYSGTKTYGYLPLTLRQWVHVAMNPDTTLERKPDQVQMVQIPND